MTPEEIEKYAMEFYELRRYMIRDRQTGYPAVTTDNKITCIYISEAAAQNVVNRIAIQRDRYEVVEVRVEWPAENATTVFHEGESE